MARRMASWMILVFLAVLSEVRATNFCKQVVEPSGYGCTEYTVQTSDGFVLVLHRLERIDSMIGDGHRGIPNSPGDSSLKQAGPAPSNATHNASSSSTPITQSSPSNYSANPEVRPHTRNHPILRCAILTLFCVKVTEIFLI